MFSCVRLCSVLSICAVLTCSGFNISAQTLTSGKAKFDAGGDDLVGAAADFAAVLDIGPSGDKPEAAAFLLRTYGTLGNHSAVESNFERCEEAAAGTSFAPEVRLEFGKSLQNNAKAIPQALEQFATILNNHGSHVFAASGAIYQRGLIELNDLKQYETAAASFEQVVQSYTSSPFVDDALVAKAKTGVALKDLEVIDAATTGLINMNASAGMLQKARMERAQYMNRVKISRHEAIYEFLATARDYSGAENSQAAALAKIRAADLVPKDNFRTARGLYQEALNTPGLPAPQREWAQLHTAIYDFQMEKESEARAGFAALLESNPGQKTAREARRFLNGIDEPNSTDSLTITYDRAIRNHSTRVRHDRVFFDMNRIIAKSKQPFFQQYVGNSGIDKEERSQMLYRVCFSYLNCGYGEVAFRRAGEILDQLEPEGVTRHQCMYVRAHLLSRASKWEESIPIWRDLINEEPKYEVLVNSYLELSRALDFSGDLLGALLQLEELIARLPQSYEAEQAAIRRDILMIGPEQTLLAMRLEAERPRMIAKWKGKTAHEVAEPTAPTAPAIHTSGGGQ